MTTSFHFFRTQPSARWTRIGFLAIAMLFNLCLAQLLTVGLAVFYSPTWWSHVWFVRGYSGLAVLLLAGLLISPFPRKIQMLTGSLVTLLILQLVTYSPKSSLTFECTPPAN